MSEAEGAPVAESAAEQVSAEDWNEAVRILGDALTAGAGCVSSIALRAALEKKGIKNARALVVRLRFFEPGQAAAAGLAEPTFRWRGHAKSFYSEARFTALQQETTKEAEQAAAESIAPAAETSAEDDDAGQPVRERRRNRQEEGRLGTYVAKALEDVYQSEHAPDDCPYVFDVHNERAGTDFENVDVMAVHWRSPVIAELVAIEVKLDFTARLVQQAHNYSRFAERVWVAVPLLAETADAGAALREYDPSLFEHLVEIGLGILACRRRPGRSYDIVPVHWPRRQRPDPVERDAFIERYRKHFEKALVVEPRRARHFPTR